MWCRVIGLSTEELKISQRTDMPKAEKRKICNHNLCRGNEKAVKNNVCLYKKLKLI